MSPVYLHNYKSVLFQKEQKSKSRLKQDLNKEVIIEKNHRVFALFSLW